MASQAANGNVAEETDADLVWLESATEEDISEHLQRVKEIFEAYDISPASTPSSSGRSSPSSPSPSLTNSTKAEQLQEQVVEALAYEPSQSVASRKAPPERSKWEEGSGTGNLKVAAEGGTAAEQQRKEEKEVLRHRRNSSLIDTIVLGEFQESNDKRKKKTVEMKSTIFSKLLKKHSDR